MDAARSLDSIRTAALALGLDPCAEVTLPGCPARVRPLPEGLHPRLRALLAQQVPQGLYAHQAEGIAAGLAGENLCLATPTASGKSLVFMATALHAVLSRPGTRVLALYPVKALIQDQLDKWRRLLDPLGLSCAFIDGSVPPASRAALLEQHPVILMTPDVLHAWMLSHLEHAAVRRFLAELRLLVLDEAHVYEGVFGTNMAYLLHRLQAVSALRQIIASTATVGDPGTFLEKLTGRTMTVFDQDSDGTGRPGRTLLLLRPAGKGAFEQHVGLLRALLKQGAGRFLAFADSRKMVEQIVSALSRSEGAPEGSEDEPAPEGLERAAVLPYRAGYEDDDRKMIQSAMEKGELLGVVSTSALELGLDIGDLHIVVMLGIPASMKAFWQRAGRVGRRAYGICLVVDDRGLATAGGQSFEDFLARPVEESWLYLENRYVQYANALCAAFELSAADPRAVDRSVFSNLPELFSSLLDNELNPSLAVPEDLYPLKQRAQGGPHLEFPVRSGIEKSLAIRLQRGPHLQPLGSVSFSQSLREAFPGAVYYYMGRPYRVFQYKLRNGEISVKPERRVTTKATLQSKVFPKFTGGTLNLTASEEGFIAEAEVQVSERIVGFTEQRGSARLQVQYGPDCAWAQRPLTRFFETTGVCWYFDDRAVLTEELGQALLLAFCAKFGIAARDLGLGQFYTQEGPNGLGVCSGLCVYDAAHGSLRLTQQLIEAFPDVIETALAFAEDDPDASQELTDGLQALLDLTLATKQKACRQAAVVPAGDEDWATLPAPGSRALLREDVGSADEVTVKGWRFTPKGLMVDLVPTDPKVSSWLVRAASVVPIHGETRLLRVNLTTGEETPLEAALAAAR
ncbi:DEAD/DEAH box helicase [Mesoterricola sediminis]|uniref:DEAD/DEAH box helicase n=1 Tax=Mesoterricola sediminis TaxID=2927980 RepID=A0AA48GR32_9BACT|nr:DEAD/DEAH box helicase [Mesoterricola sediminis]BDU76017.1 DEAD/DEAH box helicase [Mesoterricola sediminis]